jgi:hypothetical protein
VLDTVGIVWIRSWNRNFSKVGTVIGIKKVRFHKHYYSMYWYSRVPGTSNCREDTYHVWQLPSKLYIYLENVNHRTSANSCMQVTVTTVQYLEDLLEKYLISNDINLKMNLSDINILFSNNMFLGLRDKNPYPEPDPSVNNKKQIDFHCIVTS